MEDLFGLIGHQIEGRYAVDAVVAAGGFGVVYHATHTSLGAPVALKVLKVPSTLPAHLHETFTDQFLGEAKIISALQHPAIVRVTDFGVITFQNGYRSPWMALEWIEGITLARDLEARRGVGGRSPRECLDLMTPVLEALALAHAKGIAHRDIKPGNLMLPALDPALSGGASARAIRSGVPRLRLLDFGIAKILEEGDGPASGQTQTGSVMAAYSPRYAAPEQASGTRTGPWTDVHALGLLLTELLVDAPAYRSGDKMELQIQVMAARRPTPATFGVDVGAWEAVLARALALRPADRYANAGELLAALEAVVPEARPLTVVSAIEPLPTSPTVSTEHAGASTTSPASASVPPSAPRASRPVRWPLAAVAVVAVAAVTTLVATRRAPIEARPSPASAPIAGSSPHLATSTAALATALPGTTQTAVVPPTTPSSAMVPSTAPDGGAMQATPQVRAATTARPPSTTRRRDALPPTPADLRRPARSTAPGRRHNPWE